MKKSKIKFKKCPTDGCRNKISVAKKQCKSCGNRQSRKKNPIKYAYDTLKHNAKRRKKFFDLTLDQFKQFCIRTDYMQKKGIFKDSFSVDRIREEEGYTVTNLQILPVGKNKKKHLEYDWQTGTARVITAGAPQSNREDLPF